MVFGYDLNDYKDLAFSLEIVMRKIAKAIDTFSNAEYEECVYAINQFIDDSSYELLMARRGLEKIYRNKRVSESQKIELIEQLKSKISIRSETIGNSYHFLQIFLPIGDKILARMGEIIVQNFPNSMTIFYYCLGRFVEENPDIIGTAKNIMLSVAQKHLKNDLSILGYQLSISLENIYVKNKINMMLVYEEAISYGVLIEKYDAISFGNEYIHSISSDSIPKMIMKLDNPDFEYGLKCGSVYHNHVVRGRYDEEPGYIESFYRCSICKYCSIVGVQDFDKEMVFDLLKRQFANRNQTDLFFFYTGDYQSYVLSILSCIYTHLLLLLISSDQTMKVITKAEIFEKMLWGDSIDIDVFDDCYRLIISDKDFNKYFLLVNDDIIVGKWQMDLDLSIIELAKSIALNSKESHIAGKNSNAFGKETYEKIIRMMVKDMGWQVVPTSIKIKNGKQTQTDIDLIAYNNGNVIIGQIKFANSGRTKYDIWNAKQSINKAVSQVNLSMSKLSEDYNLLYSILKKHKICKEKGDIGKIIPVVITSSSYFIGAYDSNYISVISWDMFCQILKSVDHYDKWDDVDGYFSNVFSLYDFGMSKKITISEIETKDFYIQYEEYDW